MGKTYKDNYNQDNERRQKRRVEKKNIRGFRERFYADGLGVSVNLARLRDQELVEALKQMNTYDVEYNV